MPHPLVTQLRFARSEFVRCLDGVSEADGVRRLEPMNCISWNIGHLAFQEQVYWLLWAQKRILHPELLDIAGWGCGPNTPPLSEMWDAWRAVTAADEYLGTITQETIVTHLEGEDGPVLQGVLVSAQIFDPRPDVDLKDRVTVQGSTTTDGSGSYAIFVAPGTYRIVAYEDGYSPARGRRSLGSHRERKLWNVRGMRRTHRIEAPRGHTQRAVLHPL